MMTRNDLTAREVAELTPGKTYRVSRNLYLRNEPPNRSWIMIYRSPVTHKHTEMGLGSYPLISVPAARAAVKEHQLAIFHGRCPLAEKRAKPGTAGRRCSPSRRRRTPTWPRTARAGAVQRTGKLGSTRSGTTPFRCSVICRSGRSTPVS